MSQIFCGIDPGVGRTGIAFIQDTGHKVQALYYNCIETPANTDLAKRIHTIYHEVFNLLQEYQPVALFIEELFFAKNAKTALQVGHARGVILLAGQECEIPIYEFKPLEVKQAVSGDGRADKKQVQSMVKILYGLDTVPQPDDTADALAVAWCGATAYKMLQIK